MEFTCPIVRELKPIDFTDPGLIKRIRGNAYCTKVSPQIANRVAESSRGKTCFSMVCRSTRAARCPESGMTFCLVPYACTSGLAAVKSDLSSLPLLFISYSRLSTANLPNPQRTHPPTHPLRRLAEPPTPRCVGSHRPPCRTHWRGIAWVRVEPCGGVYNWRPSCGGDCSGKGALSSAGRSACRPVPSRERRAFPRCCAESKDVAGAT